MGLGSRAPPWPSHFLNKTIGFEYGKKEELYLKYISQQRIRWKKMKFESKKVNSTSQDL